ncbi:MAG: RNA-binding S4 domain-containing protein [Pseudomonadota bacterium]
MSDAVLDTARLDVWLWRARFFKTRALAGQAVSKRGVRLTRFGQTRRTSKPGAGVAVGDVLTFTKGSHIEVIQVLALGERRGPASEAQGLYELWDTDDV